MPEASRPAFTNAPKASRFSWVACGMLGRVIDWLAMTSRADRVSRAWRGWKSISTSVWSIHTSSCARRVHWLFFWSGLGGQN